MFLQMTRAVSQQSDKDEEMMEDKYTGDEGLSHWGSGGSKGGDGS